MLSSASSLVPGAPLVPTIPEIALAKRNDTFGGAKIGVFAYHRVSKEPVWQAGIQARSTSKDVWLFGAGPFQRGSDVYDAPRFAGSKLRVPLVPQNAQRKKARLATFRPEAEFIVPAEEGPSAKHEAPVVNKASKSLEPPTPEPQLLPAG